MVSFNQFCEDTEVELGRELLMDELVFLRWLHEQYVNEQKKVNV